MYMSKMKKLYQEVEEFLMDERNVIDLLQDENFKKDLGTEYTHIKNHFEKQSIKYEDEEDNEKDPLK